jgi:hypothetical protein
MSQNAAQQHISGALPKSTDGTAISPIAIDVLSVPARVEACVAPQLIGLARLVVGCEAWPAVMWDLDFR